MYSLYIANKNYSSWSLRPWVVLRELGIPFDERLIVFGDEASWDAYRALAPSGKVPCLVDGDTTVWDSLAIVEYLAEFHPGVWPADRRARAWARSAAAEMHSGFGELRSRCSMSCGVRVTLHEMPPGLRDDLVRLQSLWNDGLTRHGGPYLAGYSLTAVDAFFAPVAFRLQTYGLTLDGAANDYATRLRNLESMRAWYASALEETTRDPPHDAWIATMGHTTEDLRAI